VSVRLVRYELGIKDQLLAGTLLNVGANVVERIRRALDDLGAEPPPGEKTAETAFDPRITTSNPTSVRGR
jgi:hypothetical protein